MTQIEKEVKAAIIDYQKGAHTGMMDELSEVKKLYQREGKTDAVLRVCVKGGHQRRLPNARVDDAVMALRQFDFSKTFASFEDVYDYIKRLIGSIPRMGGFLTIYDIARRLGHLLDVPVYPKNYVYVACGARTGAKYVLGIKKMKREVFCLPITDFENLFPEISSMEIEDILCIYFHDGKLKLSVGNAFSVKGCGKKTGRKSGC